MQELVYIPHHFVLIMVSWYPLWLMLFELGSEFVSDIRNKEEAAQLGLIEYYMVEVINTLRCGRGEKPIDHQPVINSFDSRGWEMLRLKCRQTVLGMFRKLSWTKELQT